MQAGPNAFRAGLTHYLNSHAYGNARSSDFWNALSQSSGLSEISEMMRSWTLQVTFPHFFSDNQVGYPMINASYNSVTQTLEISQSRFLISDSLQADIEGLYFENV